ncbi:MAG: tRNA (adenosine(37)-N6)-threonylcarbamoyltransferase complex dimerization subunit type 1 TsaB [Chitinophagales bacterium]
MALILNIDTSTKVCSVALGLDGKLLVLQESFTGHVHASQLNMVIETVLKQANHGFKDLTAVAISAGPGSYTGLRIGTSTCKGLCYALDIPLISVNTLKALAWKVDSFFQDEKERLYVPMIDARRMEVYAAYYNNQMEQLVAPHAWIVDKEQPKMNGLVENKAVYYFGNGSKKCEPILSGENVHFLNGMYCSAGNMVELAEIAHKQEQFVDTAYYEPFYLKKYIPLKSKKTLV